MTTTRNRFSIRPVHKLDKHGRRTRWIAGYAVYRGTGKAAKPVKFMYHKLFSKANALTIVYWLRQGR